MPTAALAVDAILPQGLNPWVITRPMAHLLASLVGHLSPRSVLEFGAGWSSVILAHALAAGGGGRLTSIDHQPSYASEAWSRVQRQEGVDARLVSSPLSLRLRREGWLWGYTGIEAPLRARGPFDLVLVDGPPCRFGRASTLHDAYPHLAPGAVVVLDDAERIDEQTTMARWRATYPGLHLLEWDPAFGHGVAIFAADGARRKRFAPRAVAGTVRDRVRAWRQTGAL